MKLNIYKHWEGQIIQVNGGGLPQTITIGNIYRPPRPLNENYNEFLNEFTTVISSMQNHYKNNLILAGDYNINMLKINEQENCSRFFDSLFPKITLPTRFITCNGTLIDNFFCNLTKYILESTAGILIKQFSDYQPYFIIMDTTLQKQHPTTFIKINIQNKKAMLKVKEDLISSKIYEKLDISPTADINRNYNIILDEINQAKNKYMMSKFF